MSTSESPEDLDYLTECPSCGLQYNETTRCPRSLPCCTETLCQQCLVSGQIDGVITCPQCKKQNKELSSVDEVPLDSVAMKLLQLVGSSDSIPVCDYCSFKKDAVAICHQCEALLCQACLSTHVLGALPTSHNVTMFQDMKHRHFARRASYPRSLSLNSVSLLGHLKEKEENVKNRIDKLEEVYRNITVSKHRAAEDITETFDGLVKLVLQRKEALLSQVTARADEDARLVTAAKVEHQALYGKIKKQARNISRGRKGHPSATLALVQDNAVDINFVRRGVTFVSCNVQHLSSIMKTAGLVRTVIYSTTDRPEGVPAAVTYNAITMDPYYLPSVSDEDVGFLSHSTASSEQTCSLGDQVVVLKSGKDTKTLFCPYLEWDTSTASKTLTTTRSIVTNVKPEVLPPRTGCRIGAERHVMTTKPLLMRNGQQAMYQVKLSYLPKMVAQENKMLFEVTLTNSPVETSLNKPIGLSVTLASCPDHQKLLCIHVIYDNQLLLDVPVSKNEADLSNTLHFGFLLNSAKNEIHVLDVDDVSVLKSITDIDFEKPLWVMMMMSYPSWSSMISGTGVRMSKRMNHLLSSLQ